MANSEQSPFKFLNAFEKGDKELFFGREEEVAHLYDLTFDTRLIVFFGASGTGKTSLVQCGLANKFSETRWNELYIRRGSDINQSILDELNNALAPFLGESKVTSALEGLRLLNRYTAKPIFLTFDQFEELFILNPSPEEQEAFFTFLQAMLDASLSVKSILVMREEFIAHLWDFEYLVPSIFDNRLRIKQLEHVQMEAIVKATLDKLADQDKLRVENADGVAGAILEILKGGRTEVGLTYMQVLLERLYQRIKKESEALPTFNVKAVEAMGTIEDVIDEFLQDQLADLEYELRPGLKGVPVKILGAMISDERTKKVMELDDLEAIRIRYGLSEEEMQLCLQTFERMRILNRYES